MPKKNKKVEADDPDIREEPDDEALAGEEQESDDEEPEPDRPKSPDDDPEFWKKKYYDSERSKGELSSEFREKINTLQDQVRKAEQSRLSEPEGGAAAPVIRPRTPAYKESGGEQPPFRLVKYIETHDRFGNKISVPREIPGVSFEDHPRQEDVPERTIVAWGAGDYKIRDGTGKIVGSFTVASLGTDPNAVGAGPALMGSGVTGASITAYMQDPVQRALNLFDRAKERGDERLMAMAGQALERALAGGTPTNAPQDQLSNALATITALFGAMNQAQNTFRGAGFGNPEPAQVQMKRLEMELADKRMAGIEKTVGTVLEKGKGVVEEIFAHLKKPDINREAVGAAAARVGGGTTATYTPVAPPSLPPPRAPPPPHGQPQAPAQPQAPPPNRQAPPGTKVTCGACGQIFTVISEFVNHPCIINQGAPQRQAPVPARSMEGVGMVNIPEDFKTYLSYLKSLSTYIVAWADGDKDAAPEAVAGTIWLGTSVSATNRAKILGLVEQGYDQIVGREDLKKIIAGLDKYPNFTREEAELFITAALLSEIVTQEDVDSITSIEDASPAVDEFRNHIKIQLSPKGREWFCKLLNAIALKANKAVPHPEFLPGAGAARKSGADNL